MADPQSIPPELLSTPTRLELDKPTQEAKTGSTVTYTVTLKDGRDRAVASSRDLQVLVETPAGKQTVVLPAGQSSIKFTWRASKSGVAEMTVRSGALRPATALVLVAPPPSKKLTEIQRAPASVDVTKVSPRPEKKKKRSPEADTRGVVGTIAGAPPSGTVAGEASPNPGTRTLVSRQAKKLKVYVTPLPVYGEAVNHLWQATVSVAALSDDDSLAPVTGDVNIHFNASMGKVSPADIILSDGQLSNFQSPAVLTDDRLGKGSVEVISSLGPAGPVEVDFLLPPPTQLRLALSSPVLSGAGSSMLTVQVCLLDESGGVTSSSEDLQVTLTPSAGRLNSLAAKILRGSSCSDSIEWNSNAGLASILAESSGLKPDNKSATFPAFPWYLVWFAALGGLVGGLVRSWGNLFSAKKFLHALQSIALGALLGFVFYLFVRFGAVVLPKDFPVKLQNIPVISGTGSFLIGFVGGVIGKSFWKVGKGT